MSDRSAGGRVLLLYQQHMRRDAATIDEHIAGFGRLSEYEFVPINVTLGFPAALNRVKFDAVVLHYTIFGLKIVLPEPFRHWLVANPDVHRIAFFQDEHRYCGLRFDFLNTFDVQTVFTLLEPSEHQKVYGAHANVKRIVRTLTGYVDHEMVADANARQRPDAQRTVDVAYRARKLAAYMGAGAQEKHQIAEQFTQAVRGRGLTLDISTDHADRLYGDAWYDFLANAKAVLGVEAGTSVFDLTDEVREAYESMLDGRDEVPFEEFAPCLEGHEDKVFYRTISPRHFEAAAFRCVQILYEGWYSGVLEPGRHYIELKKDFSNIEEVLATFNDPAERERIRDTAYADLIASGEYTYAVFINEFDQVLVDAGVGESHPRLTVGQRLALWDRAPHRLAHAYALDWWNNLMRALPAPLADPLLKVASGLVRAFRSVLSRGDRI